MSHARRRERHRRLVPGVVRAEHHGSLARQHAEAIGVQVRGRGEHHPGQVVAAEPDRTLVRAGREHHPASPHVVDPLDRRRALVHHHVPVVVDAERGRIGEHGDLRGARERGGGGRDPRLGAARRRPCRPSVTVPPSHDRSSTSITRSPAAAASVAARRPAMPAPTTSVSTCTWRWRAAGAPASSPGSRPTPARDVATSPSTSGTAVAGTIGPERRRRDLDERVRLLDAGRHDAAGAPLQRRARDHVDAVREQRARERVAGEPLVRDAVEGERERPRPVDAVARGCGEPPAAHGGVTVRRGAHLVRRGVPVEVEPPAAAGGVHPALGPPPPRVVAHEEVVGPLLVGHRAGVGRVGDARLPAVAELDLVARAAPRAGDQQHAVTLPARRRSRPGASGRSCARLR